MDWKTTTGDQTMELTLVTYNIHKGFDFLGRKFILDEIRSVIRDSGADIVCLQEVQGAHVKRESQMEYLADSVWSHYAYGKNAVYDEGHHGNCILSKFPIIENHNRNLSVHRFEYRGLLSTKILIPPLNQHLAILTTHLNLLEHHRKKQIPIIRKFFDDYELEKIPVLFSGDFNDWRNSLQIGKQLGLKEVPPLPSFPSIFPMVSLDRVYYRGFKLKTHRVLSSSQLKRLSDHLPVLTVFEMEDQ